MQINELDKAQLKYEFRQMYKSIGYDGCLQVSYELITAFNLLIEIIGEETEKHDKH